MAVATVQVFRVVVRHNSKPATQPPYRNSLASFDRAHIME
jgi:hypothetical protein